jgi:hypothetical protein
VQVSEAEVFNSIMSIHSNVAGFDEVPLTFMEIILPVIPLLVVLSLIGGKSPKNWPSYCLFLI